METAQSSNLGDNNIKNNTGNWQGAYPVAQSAGQYR